MADHRYEIDATALESELATATALVELLPEERLEDVAILYAAIDPDSLVEAQTVDGKWILLPSDSLKQFTEAVRQICQAGLSAEISQSS